MASRRDSAAGPAELSDSTEKGDLTGASLIFRPKNSKELSELDDESLFAYLVASRDAGDHRAMSEAVYALIQARLPMVQAMVARKVPKHARDDLFADIIGEAFVSLSKSFQGEHVGAFVNFLKQVTARRIADFHDKQSRQPRTESLDPAHEDDRVTEPEGGITDPEGLVELQDAIERVLVTRSEDHREVIRLRIEGVPSKEVTTMIEGQTVANVDQIFFRFRKDLRKELDV